MPDLLIYADSFRSADMRHAVPLAVPDPFLYAEENGSRHVFAPRWRPRACASSGSSTSTSDEELGFDELVASGVGRSEVDAQLALRPSAASG